MADPVAAFEQALRAHSAAAETDEARVKLQLHFPWSDGYPAYKALEQQWNDLEHYRLQVRKLASEDRSLTDHYRLVDEAQSALLSVKIKLQRANQALYR